MVPGSFIVLRAARASRMIRLWRLTLPGSPNMLPRANLTSKARGGLIRAILSGAFPMEMVGIPASSTIR